MTADFHVHTYASDGLLSPEDVAKTAAAAGLGAVAVTDHDTVFNVAETAELCKQYGVKAVTGVEISAYAGDLKVHTLGYGFDAQDPLFSSYMRSLAEGSEARAKDISEKLAKSGVILSYGEISAERFSPLTPVHAMHVCRAAVKRGYARDPFGFYREYLMPGKPAFSLVGRTTPEEAIGKISSAGGVAALAHPGRIALDKKDLTKLIERLVKAGLQGIEAVYSTHTSDETAYFLEIAEAYGLYVTGGSDCHFYGGKKQIGKPLFSPSEELRRRLKI